MSKPTDRNLTAPGLEESQVKWVRELPDPTAVQIDKRQEEWLLTYWINPGVTVRLRIHHSGYSVEPDELVCEISASRTDYEFQEVARVLWHPDDDPIAQEWPGHWRASFMRLANLWFVLVAVAEWGLALGRVPAADDAGADHSVTLGISTSPALELEGEASHA